jgi:hypothetical protein
MIGSENCKITTDCKTHWCGIFGIVLIVLATILTFVTSSGLGILGLFFAGIMMCCHKHWSCGKTSECRCCCGCKCCDTEKDKVCDVVEHKHQV